PAFPMVWALRAFADGVQFEFAQQVARLREAVRRGQLDAQPFRQTRSRFQFSRRHCKTILTTDGRGCTRIKRIVGLLGGWIDGQSQLSSNPNIHLSIADIRVYPCPSVVEIFFQNSASSSGPKSARIWPSTSITGARRWPERLTISVIALLSAITSSVSYWMPRSSSQCCALWHQPQYGLMKRRIFIDEHLSTDRHRIFIEWRQPERFRQMLLHWNQSLHRRLATPNLFNNGMNRLFSMV